MANHKKDAPCDTRSLLQEDSMVYQHPTTNQQVKNNKVCTSDMDIHHKLSNLEVVE